MDTVTDRARTGATGQSLGHTWDVSTRARADAAAVHLPFTAPRMIGVRVRQRQGRLDFLLPNPGGGRGAYVLGWAQAAELGGPTLHDAMLGRRLQDLPVLAPTEVRRAARAVALEGYAGRAAAEAAIRAQNRLDSDSLRLWAGFLLDLVRRSSLPAAEQAELLAGLGRAGPGVSTPGLEAMAERLGWNPVLLPEALDRLSIAHVPVLATGRVPRLIAMVGGTGRSLSADPDLRGNDNGQASATIARMRQAADRCAELARSLFDEAVRALEEPARLLALWREDQAAALAPVRAAEDALDGWDRICLLWQDAQNLSARLRLLPELALLMHQAGPQAAAPESDVAGSLPAGHAHGPPRPAAPEEADATHRRLDRNERVRARELDLEFGDA